MFKISKIWNISFVRKTSNKYFLFLFSYIFAISEVTKSTIGVRISTRQSYPNFLIYPFALLKNNMGQLICPPTSPGLNLRKFHLVDANLMT